MGRVETVVAKQMAEAMAIKEKKRIMDRKRMREERKMCVEFILGGGGISPPPFQYTTYTSCE